MSKKYNAIKLNRKDNVAVALRSINPGDFLAIQGENEAIEIKENIPYGHKIATIYIPKDGKIIKYGECMGISTEEIHPGFHVHVSNVRGLKEEERLSAHMEVQQR